MKNSTFGTSREPFNRVQNYLTLACSCGSRFILARFIFSNRDISDSRGKVRSTCRYDRCVCRVALAETAVDRRALSPVAAKRPPRRQLLVESCTARVVPVPVCFARQNGEYSLLFGRVVSLSKLIGPRNSVERLCCWVIVTRKRAIVSAD